MAGQSATPLPLVVHGARALGLSLTDGQLRQLDELARLLAERAKRFSLTSIRTFDDIQVAHLLDSLTPVPYIDHLAENDQNESRTDEAIRVVDVGSGAGLPGLVLAIALPAIEVTLVEATSKKAAFIDEAISVLGLQNARVIQGRAEDVGRDPQFRERFNVAIARAVASSPTLVELLVPLLRVGGRAIFMKTEQAADEVRASGRALEALDSVVERVVEVRGIASLRNRMLIIVKKRSNSDGRYPRRVGVPHHHPIGL
ncbi:MAG: hypothetical protein HW416_1020 [Chloroflexi bacterium]|nr:hypothetical protein [Chloroflexota bacterium]